MLIAYNRVIGEVWKGGRAAVMVIMFAVPVMAVTIKFNFRVEDAEDTSPVAYSGVAEKDNYNNQAFIECTNSNITENDDFSHSYLFLSESK